MTATHISLNLEKICRGCLTEEDNMPSVFRNDTKSNFIKMFESCTSIQIKEDDGLPTHMCSNCILRLNESFQFQRMCVQSDCTLRAVKIKSGFASDASDACHVNNNEEMDNIDVCFVDEDEMKKNCISTNEFEDIENETIIEIVENEEKSDYNCSVCSETFYTLVSLKQHEFSFHRRDKKCPTCNTTFADDVNHLCKNVINKTGIKKYQCKECDKEYTSSHNLQIHMYSHTGYKPYSCDYCGKSFTKINALNSHVSLHTGYLSYLCSECGKGFSTATGLKRHKISHSGERPYKCKICPGSFAASGDLTVHMRSHTGEKPYLCPTCGKAFARISHLNIHARTHTGEKPYKCGRCDRGFAQSGDLKSHERTHTGEKPYECSVCKKRFIQCSGLASHMRTHTGEKSYACSICYKSFSQPSSLTRHKRCHSE